MSKEVVASVLGRLLLLAGEGAIGSSTASPTLALSRDRDVLPFSVMPWRQTSAVNSGRNHGNRTLTYKHGLPVNKTIM